MRTRVTPAAGAAVMATGIVSVGLHLAGADRLSAALLLVAIVLWALLGAVFLARLAGDRPEWTREAVTPPALTGVAATGVLGTRIALGGGHALAGAALAVAAALWAALIVGVVRGLRGRLPGAAELVTVSTQALAVLGGTLAAVAGARWLLWPASVLLAVGLVLYVRVLVRFDYGQLRTGRGDHWVIGGAVAISALAASKLAAATAPAGAVRWETGADGLARGVTAVLLAVALGWYAVLVVCEIRWPRLSYDVRRWSTVFPLGMTAAATISAGTVLKAGRLTSLGEVLLWPAVAVWAVVAVGALRHLPALLKPGAP
ncbi:tellurite resistance/C4-dicarboxylate transporter family protein [Actinomadura parmotrematis]|uniref:Tellurite resistance/C4-dicarboxylate transporter family protein n=1 Tax=Actinomadura parmotrematis TaxID=2864039 RepID=A0ABS7FL94_9ACTN|nr:tellurite resistance/C4-dicarboxylate transporter family protein [Actinomadura parmotrematis]MBW8481131.1 tellurite resistance/C4-dicarboxylate transporter family protein [Actinomadura parmotrematis]